MFISYFSHYGNSNWGCGTLFKKIKKLARICQLSIMGTINKTQNLVPILKRF